MLKEFEKYNKREKWQEDIRGLNVGDIVWIPQIDKRAYAYIYSYCRRKQWDFSKKEIKNGWLIKREKNCGNSKI